MLPWLKKYKTSTFRILVQLNPCSVQIMQVLKFAYVRLHVVLKSAFFLNFEI